MNVPRTIGKLFGWSVIGNIVSLAGVAYFANELGSAGLGSFFLFRSVVAISVLVGDVGISVSVEKRISSGKPRDLTTWTGLYMKLLPMVLITGLLLFFEHRMINYIGIDVIFLLIIAIISRHLFRLFRGSLRGAQLVEETASFTGIRNIVWVVIGVLLTTADFGVKAPIYGTVIGNITIVALSALKLQPFPHLPDLGEAIAIWDIAKWSVVSDVGGAVYNWMDVVLIGSFLGQSAVGIYEIAWSISSATLLLSQAVRQTAFPKINAEGDRESTSQIEELMTQFFTPSLYFVIPSLVGVIVIGPDILSVIFGPEFGSGSLVLIILMVEKVQRSFSYILIAPAYAVDRADIAAKSTAASIFSNLVLNILLIPHYGIEGAAIATMAAETINFTMHGLMISKYVSIKPPWREFAGTGIAAIIMGAIIFLITQSVNITGIFELVVIIGLAAIIYICGTIIDPVVRNRLNAGIREFLL